MGWLWRRKIREAERKGHIELSSIQLEWLSKSIRFSFKRACTWLEVCQPTHVIGTVHLAVWTSRSVYSNSTVSNSKYYFLHVPPFVPESFVFLCVIQKYKDNGIKGKGRPRTGHEGPEGEQMCSSTLPSTSALDGGGWSAPRYGRFTPGKDPVPIVQEAG